MTPLGTDKTYLAGWNAAVDGHCAPSMCPRGMKPSDWTRWQEGYQDASITMEDDAKADAMREERRLSRELGEP